jgi:hypothetical protein
MAQIDEDYQSGGVPCRILWCDCEIMVNGVTLDATGWKVMV